MPSSATAPSPPDRGQSSLLVEGPHECRHRRDLADQEAALVDGVTADALQHTAVRPRRVPDLIRRQRRVVAGHLQVADPHVMNRAQPSVANHLPRQAHGRKEAVVEHAHRQPAAVASGVAHPPRVGQRDRQRLLADHVLAGAERGNGRLDVHRIRPAIVEQVDRRVVHDLAPVGATACKAVLHGPLTDHRLTSPANRRELGLDADRRIHVVDRTKGVGVTTPHEAVSQHANANDPGHSRVLPVHA